MDADDLAEFESNSYYDREFEAKEDDGSLKEEEPRHPNDLGGALPPEQDLSLVPFVNEHQHATTPSGHESLMQLNTGKRKLTGEEETNDSRKKQQLTNMVFRNSSTRPYSQMPQPPYQYPTLNQTTNRLAPQLPHQYPTLNQTKNRLAPQPPYQYPTHNQTTNRQQDSSSQRGPNAAAPVQQRTQSQWRNATSSTARRRIQDSAHQRRRYHPSVSQNQGRNHSNQPPGMQQRTQSQWRNATSSTGRRRIQDSAHQRRRYHSSVSENRGRNHLNQPPGMQQARRPDMNQQSRMGINPNISYLRFRYGYFSGQAGTIDQQHSGPPMNIQEPSPDTTLLPEMNQQMQPQGDSSYQGEQMQPQVPPQQRQETEPHGVNLESHLTKEDKDVGED